MARASTTVRSLLAATGLAACVIGFRSEVDFRGSFPLGGATTVQVEVGDAPVTVIGSAVIGDLQYEGTWFSVGGSKNDAEDNASSAELRYDVDGDLGRLFAAVPVDKRGLIDLELSAVRLPETVDVEITTGLGTIVVRDVDAAVSAEAGRGAITIDGGRDSVFAHTELGDIEIATPASLEVYTGYGDVGLTQTGVLREVHATSEQGDVYLAIESDTNLRLDVRAGGDITVDTDQITTRTQRRFERSVGQGSVTVRIVARRGSVLVEQLDSDVPDGTTSG